MESSSNVENNQESVNYVENNYESAAPSAGFEESE